MLSWQCQDLFDDCLHGGAGLLAVDLDELQLALSQHAQHNGYELLL